MQVHYFFLAVTTQYIHPHFPGLHHAMQDHHPGQCRLQDLQDAAALVHHHHSTRSTSACITSLQYVIRQSRFHGIENGI